MVDFVSYMDFFNHLPLLPPDSIFGIVKSFLDDPRDNKINAVVGAYKSEDLKSYVFTSVRKAEALILAQKKNKDYLPIDGDRDYILETQKLVFGKVSQNIYGAQSLGGTGALRTCADFLRLAGCTKAYISDPTWANHRRIFANPGFQVETYPYYDNGIDFEAMVTAFERMDEKSVVVMQAACHNPTGSDLTLEQWKKVCKIAQKKRLFIVFDLAYQGFGKGLDEDVAAIAYFLSQEIEFAVAVSHSKAFGLYAERVGALYIVSQRPEIVASHVKEIIRGIYSNPPCHGAWIVSRILKDRDLRKEWEEELVMIRRRIFQMRTLLADELSLDFLNQQQGMFSFIGLQKEVVQKLRDHYGIYLPGDGRINVAGLNAQTIRQIAKAIVDCEKKRL